MLVIKLTSESNGAVANQIIYGRSAVPDGYAAVPEALESETLSMLPWIIPTIENGVVTAISENTEAKAAWVEPAPDIDQITHLQLAIAELAEAQAADQTENELALAELAGLIAGGE